MLKGPDLVGRAAFPPSEKEERDKENLQDILKCCILDFLQLKRDRELKLGYSIYNIRI
jgi:hypothetical protein